MQDSSTSIMSALLIHYHYPPMRNSGVYRNYFLSHALADEGLQVHVITTSNIHRLPKDELPGHPDVHVIPVATLDYRTIISWLSATASKGAQFGENTKQHRLVKWMLRIQRSFPFHLLLAEGSMTYILAAYIQAIRLIRRHRITMVYTSFMPYADHWVGWLLKVTFPRIQWIADFRDLHAEPIYKNVVLPGIQRSFERFLLRKATAVTTVSEGISDKMRQLHPRVTTVTKGIRIRPQREKYRIFTISYTGSLFLDFRDPSPLFRTLKYFLSSGKMQPSEIRVLYAGKDGRRMKALARQFEVEQILVDMGFVSHTEALEIQDRSHVNLLLTTASETHSGLFSGKFFEYLEADTPMLCLVKGSPDPEIESLVLEFRAGYVYCDTPTHNSDLQTRMATWFDQWKSTGNLNHTPRRDALTLQYSWQSRAKKILSSVE